jgi:hypothetical protein
MRKLILALAACSALAACEKPSAKFRSGDQVTVKLSPDTKGVIVARLSPFVDDFYYLRVPGAEKDLHPGYDIEYPNWHPRQNWHLEGPYYDTDLELTTKTISN